MNVVEIISKDECSLCDQAKELLARLRSEYSFEIKETKLTPEHPLYQTYKNLFRVILAPNGRRVSGKVSEEQARELLHSLTPPPRIYYVAKFLEALGIVSLLFGFFHGMLGDMWTDLYFFLGGIVVFAVGWTMEKWEARQRRKSKQRAT